MEAKDTVRFECQCIYHYPLPEQNHHAARCWELYQERVKQAEISFKAGEDKGTRKVVEWLERAKKIKVPKYQLKEWGVE